MVSGRQRKITSRKMIHRPSGALSFSFESDVSILLEDGPEAFTLGVNREKGILARHSL
jgi:hypothetical protein